MSLRQSIGLTSLKRKVHFNIISSIQMDKFYNVLKLTARSLYYIMCIILDDLSINKRQLNNKEDKNG